MKIASLVKTSPLTSSTLAAILFVGAVSFAQAQEEPTPTPTPAATSTVSAPLLAQGVSNTQDKKGRDPLVAISTQIVTNRSSGSVVQILADASITNEEYRQYPIEFQFFVNGKLFETQFRSLELPRAIGVTVDSSVAVPPFNWTIVATLLHPNRQFVTVAQGAVFAANLAGSYDCELTLSNVSTGEGATTVYGADDVTAGQLNNSSISLSFTTSTLADGGEANEVLASSTVSFNGTTASGSLTTTIDGRSQTATVTGTATRDDDAVTAFTLESADKLTKLVCN